MRPVTAFLLGALTSLVLVGFAWYVDRQFDITKAVPPQIPFDEVVWRSSDAVTRGQMERDLIQKIQSERLNKETTMTLLGLPSHQRSAGLNSADEYIVYQIDLGQRIGGMPFLHKLGVAFHRNGEYSHVTVWD